MQKINFVRDYALLSPVPFQIVPTVITEVEKQGWKKSETLFAGFASMQNQGIVVPGKQDQQAMVPKYAVLAFKTRHPKQPVSQMPQISIGPKNTDEKTDS